MADIGQTLRDTRMRNGIDVSDVEAATKIRSKYLRALENEEWGLLPGPIFVKTFLRTYAEFLGLDAPLLVDDYKQQFEQVREAGFAAHTSQRRPNDRRAKGGRVPSRAVIVGLVLVVIVILVVVLGLVGTSKASAPHQSSSLVIGVVAK